MANRFKYVLPKIISPGQTCCIIGRDISDTIASLRDIVDMAENDNIEGYIVKMDNLKAFDRVSHKYLTEVLTKFGFGNRFINWIRIFYRNIHSSVKCNGHLTKYFPIKNSVRQGCPISALLYVLTAEPLSNAIRANRNIHGISIPGSQVVSKFFQHADDSTLTLSDKKSLEESIKIFDLYGDASGARINLDKSELMCIGSGTISEVELQNAKVKLCEDAMLVLGVYVGKYKRCEELNWSAKVRQTKQILNMWIQRDLTVQGRATVVTSLVTSRLWYTAMVQAIPEWALNEIKVACVRFIWPGKAYLVAYQTLIGGKLAGGINLPDIQLKVYAFRLKFLMRFFDNSCTALWKETCAYFLKSILDMGLTHEVFYMSLTRKHLECLPMYYREMLIAWRTVHSHVHFHCTADFVFSQPLFRNTNITHDGNMLVYKEFIQAGVATVGDITYEVIPGFLPEIAVTEMLSEGNPSMSVDSIHKLYSVLIDCIPDTWKRVIRTEFNPNGSIINCEIMMHNGKITACTTCSRVWYELLVGLYYRPPASHAFWQELFGPNIPFESVWRTVHLSFKPPDTVDLDFRLFHNVIYTKEKLCKIGKVDSSVCTLCSLETEDLSHMFIKCIELDDTKQYVVEILEGLFNKSDVSYINTLSYDKLLLLGYFESRKNVNDNFVNYFISIVRLCIFKRRQVHISSGKTLDLKRLVVFTLKKYISYACEYFCKRQQSPRFKRLFSDHNPYVVLTDTSVTYLF
jgi:hypothetical protein